MNPSRFASTAALAAIAFAALPGANAQEDGCVQADPCILDVEVDEMGIASVSVVNFTSGDWYVLSVSNLDAADHTLSIEGHAVSVQVEGDLYADSAPFQFGTAGTYELRDQPTGDSADLKVLAGDSLGGSEGADGGDTGGDANGNGTPALAIGLLLIALVALAATQRR